MAYASEPKAAFVESRRIATVAHCEMLGFAPRRYERGGYGHITRDGVEIHLGVVTDLDDRRLTSAVYLWVDDADELARAWREAAAHVVGPEDTAWVRTRARTTIRTAT